MEHASGISASNYYMCTMLIYAYVMFIGNRMCIFVFYSYEVVIFCVVNVLFGGFWRVSSASFGEAVLSLVNLLCTLLLPASVENEHSHAAGSEQEQSSNLDLLSVILVFRISGASTKTGCFSAWRTSKYEMSRPRYSRQMLLLFGYPNL